MPSCSRCISEFLSALGGEALKWRFFAAYLDAVRGLVGAKGKGKSRNLGSLLIDSTGLPNSIRLPLRAVRNHNGKVNREVGLIYVLHRGRGLPLYFRCCPGNVVDVSTLGRTFAELDELGIAGLPEGHLAVAFPWGKWTGGWASPKTRQPALAASAWPPARSQARAESEAPYMKTTRKQPCFL